MVRLLILLIVAFQFASGDQNINITSSEKLENLTNSKEEIHIPSSSEEVNSNEDPFEVVLQKAKEFDYTTTDIPYLPLIQRCSIDTDCSSDTACFDGKCINAKRFQLFPYLFQRCQSRLDCPSGNKCIMQMCIPFRW
uniref:EB domain-containing protein n=1 Tax=Caenorhabditis tropicalis TaxID=1561998 RepID=A0A1I7T3C3_9PELO